MKRLTITYNDNTVLFDGLVDEFAWQDTASMVTVSGKKKAEKPAAAAGLLDMLTAASRQRTDAKKAELTAEPTKEAQE